MGAALAASKTAQFSRIWQRYLIFGGANKVGIGLLGAVFDLMDAGCMMQDGTVAAHSC